MIYALAALNAALAAALIAGGWLVLRHLDARDRLERDERARQAKERDATENRYAAQVEQLVTELRAAQDARAGEIQMLLQRIQAPEVAVIQHQQEQAGPDHAWPLSDEESAEQQQERLAMIAEIERMEREGVMADG